MLQSVNQQAATCSQTIHMRRYLFFINHLYAYSILRPLQATIRQSGGEVAWFLQGENADPAYLRDDEIQLHTVEQVKEYNPAAVFVPGNWVPGFFPGVKVEVFHGLANDETGKKGHYRIRGLFDLYCTHAPAVTEKFEQLARRYGTFKVVETGWPKLDPLFNQALSIPGPYDDFRQTVPADKPIVFYASTFSPSLTSAPTLIETIKRLSQQSDFHWLITLHPKTPEDIVEAYRNMQGDNLTYVESHHEVLPLMRAADVMLCDTSSIALEYLLLDKPLVTFNTRVPGPHAINVTRPEEIEAALKLALTRPTAQMEAARQLIQSLHAYDDGLSSQRLLEATDNFIDQGQAQQLKPKPLNLWRKFQIRKRMGYYRW